jgi:hypothetical protein
MLDPSTRQRKVTLLEPATGWSWVAYDRALEDYLATHGRAPQTITMHPDTKAAVGLAGQVSAQPRGQPAAILITSHTDDLATINLYY